MRKIVKLIAKEFNAKEIVWGVGGSYLLHRYGINNELRDIDILISEESIQKTMEVMERISEKVQVQDDKHFNSKFYEVYQMKGININIISNLSSNFEEEFSYNFDQDDISVIEETGNERINYCHLMDWYVIYKEISRKNISNSIETYYKNGGFIDNSRFHKKFGISNLNILHKSYNKLRTMIY